MPPKLRSAAATFALTLLPAGFLALMVAAPLYSLLSYQEGVPLWREVAGDAYYRRRLLWTLLQAAATVPLTMIIGIPAAWVLARLKFRGRALVLRLLMLPFVTPTLVAGIGVLALFGSHGALWPGWEDTPWLLLYGNVFFNLPVMVRAAYQGLLQVPANRLYAAQTLGAGAWRQFWLVERPVLLPWLAGGVCMVFLYCFSGFCWAGRTTLPSKSKSTSLSPTSSIWNTPPCWCGRCWRSARWPAAAMRWPAAAAVKTASARGSLKAPAASASTCCNGRLCCCWRSAAPCRWRRWLFRLP